VSLLVGAPEARPAAGGGTRRWWPGAFFSVHSQTYKQQSRQTSKPTKQTKKQTKQAIIQYKQTIAVPFSLPFSPRPARTGKPSAGAGHRPARPHTPRMKKKHTGWHGCWVQLQHMI